MSWLELRLTTNEEQAEQLEDALMDTGALAVTYTDAGDQPILEPQIGTTPLWLEIVLVALYDAKVETAAIESSLEERFIQQDSAAKKTSFRWDILEDKIWEREWLKYQQPIKFADAFWVYHEKVDDSIPTLLLDPGLAFGTGSHPTTALCLKWIAEQNWTGKSIIDYGCGSGILAVAGLLGGATSAVCIDIDPQALEATHNNAARNNISSEKISAYLPGQEPAQKSPVLVANILAGPLVKLAPQLAEKVEIEGKICLSGILSEQKADILRAYSPWFSDLETVCQDDWIRITGTRIKESTEANV